MKKVFSNPKNIVICCLSIIILILGGSIIEIYQRQPTSVFLMQPCVPDEETAISIAQIMCKVYTGVELEKDAFKAYRGKNEWQVCIKGLSDFDDKWIGSNDGGIYINKQDGTIMRANFLQEDIDEYYRLKTEYGVE